MTDNVHHQFSLFGPEEMRPKLKTPIRRISLAEYNEARRLMAQGDDRKYRALLMDVQDSLERVLNKFK